MSDHTWLDFAAPYALDVLEGEELAAFEAHLRDCPVCQGEVQEMREVAGFLAHAASPVAPPAGLRDRVLAEARQARPTADTPPVRPITSAPRTPTAPVLQKRGAGGFPGLLPLLRWCWRSVPAGNCGMSGANAGSWSEFMRTLARVSPRVTRSSRRCWPSGTNHHPHRNRAASLRAPLPEPGAGRSRARRA